jgi:hypothetical protein
MTNIWIMGLTCIILLCMYGVQCAREGRDLYRRFILSFAGSLAFIADYHPAFSIPVRKTDGQWNVNMRVKSVDGKFILTEGYGRTKDAAVNDAISKAMAAQKAISSRKTVSRPCWKIV